MPEPGFHLDDILFFLKFPLLTLNMNNKCCCSNLWKNLSQETNTYSKLATETLKQEVKPVKS